VALLASVALVTGNLSTREEIALRKTEDLERSLQQVIPAELHDNSLVHDTITLKNSQGGNTTVYRARREGEIVAFAFETVRPGYSGKIRVLLGIDTTGRIISTRVLSHTETPGLGDKIEIAKDPWILSFNDLLLGNPSEEGWKVKKDGGRFDQFTGATITPRAVVAAIHDGLVLYRDHRDEFLAETPKKASKP